MKIVSAILKIINVITKKWFKLLKTPRSETIPKYEKAPISINKFTIHNFFLPFRSSVVILFARVLNKKGLRRMFKNVAK